MVPVQSPTAESWWLHPPAPPAAEAQPGIAEATRYAPMGMVRLAESKRCSLHRAENATPHSCSHSGQSSVRHILTWVLMFPHVFLTLAHWSQTQVAQTHCSAWPTLHSAPKVMPTTSHLAKPVKSSNLHNNKLQYCDVLDFAPPHGFVCPPARPHQQRSQLARAKQPNAEGARLARVRQCRGVLVAPSAGTTRHCGLDPASPGTCDG